MRPQFVVLLSKYTTKCLSISVGVGVGLIVSTVCHCQCSIPVFGT